jgi:hypothetical protein
LYAATAGSELGFELFDTFSQQSQKHVGGETSRRWQTYHRSPPNRSPGMRSLCYVARENGWPADVHAYADKKDLSEVPVEVLLKKMGVGAAPYRRPVVPSQTVQEPPAAVFRQEAVQLVHDEVVAATPRTAVGSLIDRAIADAPNGVAARVAEREDAKLRAIVKDVKHDIDQIVESLVGRNSKYELIRQMHNEVHIRGKTTALLAMASALATLGSVLAPVYSVDIGHGPLSPNLMIAIPAMSGVGKNGPIKYPLHFMNAAGLSNVVHSQMTSDAALNGALITSSNIMLASDEFGSAMTDKKNSAAGGLDNTVMTAMTAIYTSSGHDYTTKTYAPSAKQKTTTISNPTLSAFFASTPTPLFDAIGVDRLISGFGNRMLVIPSIPRPVSDLPTPERTKTNASVAGNVLSQIKMDAEGGGVIASVDASLTPSDFYQKSYLRNSEDNGVSIAKGYVIHSQPAIKLVLSSGAAELLEKINDTQLKCAVAGKNPLFGRLVEMSLRVSVVLQRGRTLLDNCKDHEISESDLSLAFDLCLCSANVLNKATTEFEAEDAVREIADSLLSSIVKRGGIIHLSYFKKLRRAQSVLKQKAISLLKDEGSIYFCNAAGHPTSGPPNGAAPSHVKAI